MQNPCAPTANANDSAASHECEGIQLCGLKVSLLGKDSLSPGLHKRNPTETITARRRIGHAVHHVFHASVLRGSSRPLLFRIGIFLVMRSNSQHFSPCRGFLPTRLTILADESRQMQVACRRSRNEACMRIIQGSRHPADPRKPSVAIFALGSQCNEIRNAGSWAYTSSCNSQERLPNLNPRAVRGTSVRPSAHHPWSWADGKFRRGSPIRTIGGSLVTSVRCHL